MRRRARVRLACIAHKLAGLIMAGTFCGLVTISGPASSDSRVSSLSGKQSGFLGVCFVRRFDVTDLNVDRVQLRCSRFRKIGAYQSLEPGDQMLIMIGLSSCCAYIAPCVELAVGFLERKVQL